MKEVGMELQAIQMLQKAANLQQDEELEYDQVEMYKLGDALPPLTMSTSSMDAQPLLAFQSV
jgi:hypothetical protein